MGQFASVYMDVRYEKVRHNRVVVDCAVFFEIGISQPGHREVLGVSVKLSEKGILWRDFISFLKDRGLHGVKLFVSDAHQGLKAARKVIFLSVPWQRCQFYLQQNGQGYVPKRSIKKEVAGRIKAISTAPNNEEALPEGMVVFSMPQQHWRRLRTDNMLERLNKEILHRAGVATPFPNTAP